MSMARAWEGWMRDLGLALRGLRRRPGWALVATATLVLGIGASTAIFTVVDNVALRPLPIPQSGRVISILEASRGFPRMSVSWPDYLDYRDDNHVFTALAAERASDMILSHLGAPAFVAGARVTANFFALMGVTPVLGRTFTPAEDGPGAPDVVVLAASFYRSRLGGDPGWLGRSLDLDGRLRTVIGVMPADFVVPGFAGDAAGGPQFWTPLGAAVSRDPALRDRGNHAAIVVLGRLRAGVTLAAARADFAALSAHLGQRHAKDKGNAAVLQPLLDLLVGGVRPGLLALLGAAGLLLLVACANVANLLLARATAQRRADAVRTALGATRARLVRQHLAGSLVLALLGAAGGLLVAVLLLRAVGASLAPFLPRAAALTLDGRVLGVALLAALFTALLCGLAPALRAAGAPPAPALQLGALTHAGRGPGRGLLVGGEVALAVLLAVGAGLLLRSFARLQAVDPGFQPRGVLSFVIGLPGSRYPTAARQLEFFRQARRRLARLPGVAAAGGAFPLPLSGSQTQVDFLIVGRPAPTPGHPLTASVANVRGAYFQAMGIRLLRGRAFTTRDDAANAPKVAIVDDAFARRYFPGPDPLSAALGRRIEVNPPQPRTIVGVVAHVREMALNGRREVECFLPQAQSGGVTAALYFALRARAGDPLRLRSAAAAQIAALDPDLPITNVRTMRQRLAASLARRRLALWLMDAFALLALLLAGIGIYGALSYSVAQRTREIGVRMALGAGRWRVLRLVLGQGLRLALLGAVVGLVGALALAHAAAAFLYGVGGDDPLTLTLAPLLMLAIAAAAGFLPALRAARVDPLRVLSRE